MENVRGTQGMTISGTEAVKKIWNVCRKRWLWLNAKHRYLFFHLSFALRHCHARIFLSAGVKRLAWLVFRGLNNLCAALRFNLVACRRMPGRSAGMYVAGASGGTLLQWVVLLYFSFQLFGVALLVFLGRAWALMSHVSLYDSNVFSFLQ